MSCGVLERVALAFALCGVVAEAADAADTAPARALAFVPWNGLQQHWVFSGGLSRRYVLFVPESQNPSKAQELWLAFPGTDDSPEGLISQSGMTDYASREGIVIAALEGQDLSFNVEAHGQPFSDRPDDVEYTTAVLKDLIRRVNVDRRRIFCAGFSRGARMCSRLASELSNIFAAVATVSGIRFPRPNNATRPVPFIAFHGTKDPINPFWGHGAGFWTQSVPDAVHEWADFNKCTKRVRQLINSNVVLWKHTHCDNGADVFLNQVQQGGHTWPGSSKPTALGFVSHDIAATVDIGNFFHYHPLVPTCRVATPGTACFAHITWVKTTGVLEHPEWYPGLDAGQSFEHFQAYFHQRFEGNCPKPCPPTTTSTTQTTTPAVTTRTTLTTVASTTSRWEFLHLLADFETVNQGQSLLSQFRGPLDQWRTLGVAAMALVSALALLFVWKRRGVFRAREYRLQVTEMVRGWALPVE